MFRLVGGSKLGLSWFGIRVAVAFRDACAGLP